MAKNQVKKNKKKIYIGLFCFFFLCAFLFFLTPGKTLADLEVQYPQISGISLDANSKLPAFALYLFNAAMFLGFFSVFISLVIAGATWILSPVNAWARAESRDRAFGAISGLLLLILTYLIVTTINPQLASFKTSALPPAPQIPAVSKISGVYFYENPGCSKSNSGGQTDETAQVNTYSVSDLGDLDNKVSSAEIAQDSAAGISYISILYSNNNFSGKCLYIGGDQGCQSALDPQTKKPFASSASIYRYSPNSNGDGVYFYRKSNFDDKGGYLKIGNGVIGKLYKSKLDDLKFQGVPEDEQDCIKYDADGKCAKNGREEPALAGENISSIKTNGNYLVLLVYYDPKTDSGNSWTYCQEFPAPDDVNQLGPQQIKWDNIRNNNQVIPNYVIIIPIQK